MAVEIQIGARKRRVPQQSRSRDRVVRILDAAAALVSADGVDSLTTRAIAERSEIPVASLYQYFADRDEILLALVERDIEHMDSVVERELGRLQTLSVRGLATTTMNAFVTSFIERPAFVMIWLRGRTNQAITEYGRQHNRQVAQLLLSVAREHGLVRDDISPLVPEIAVEMGDRCFQLAFETSLTGDPRIIAEAIELVSSYLEGYATPAGLNGVDLPA